jgi:[ribosomal protein S18]-alanine N-acetyltransferase
VIARTPRQITVGLRPMQRPDLDAVLAIEERAFPQPWSRSFFEKELAASQAACTVAVADGDGRAAVTEPKIEPQILGYSVCWRVLDELHLLNVAVHPEHRSGAIGRRLVEAVLDDGRMTGARVVYLEVRAGNVAARRLYRRLGFRDLGVRRAYYGPGQDAIVMELRLAGER